MISIQLKQFYKHMIFIKKQNPLNKITRAIPIVGIGFFIFQAIESLAVAKNEDQLFISAMQDMETEPSCIGLLDQSFRKEWFVINSIAISHLIILITSYYCFIQKIFSIETLFFSTFILTLTDDFLIGKLSLKTFWFLEANKKPSKL